jgi:hypothetical protein
MFPSKLGQCIKQGKGSTGGSSSVFQHIELAPTSQALKQRNKGTLPGVLPFPYTELELLFTQLSIYKVSLAIIQIGTSTWT